MKSTRDSTTQLFERNKLKDALAYEYFQQRQYDKLKPLANDFMQQTDLEMLRVPGAVFTGIICFSRGEYAEAKKYMQAALEFDPTENPFDNYAGAYLALLEELAGRPDSAAVLFQTSKTDVWFANAEIPIRSEYEFLHGSFLLRQEQKQAAFEKFTELTNCFPKDYRGWYGLALYHAQQGE
ncbi:MAG: tetratricopeptide repeat protein [Saprospiraceae bacterium]|nr:tetratricopeptide repeat protein [Saprospiraceae bacterium]